MKVSGDSGGFFENKAKSMEFYKKSIYKLRCNGYRNENTGM
jgi:hypothetical protein